ncbi:putative polysaccharide biosynthesis protein [Clostridium senegalense]|uniref:putative polysaccharide biosynthesis protein n=1 Tax=Clostridium senegalense TaxID=1465809 RepID=UPI000289C6F2|nr:polysaccharide biosynthesis protein [Clostridium senegalense]MBU5226499.1 polysaccharide biosynthesis protein [Clostridium senegalense]
MKKQSLVKGTVILGFASIFARFLGLFFRIPIQGLIGDEGMGYYQMSYPLYMTFVALASGIPIAMSKIIAEVNAKNDYEGTKRILKDTLMFMIPIGIVASAIMFSFAKPIITGLKWHQNSYIAFLAISIAPIFVCIMCTFRGFFQGMQNMTYTGISQIVEQLGRVIGGVLFAYLLLPKGIAFAAGGAALGTVIGGILGSIYLVIAYMRQRPIKRVNKNLKTKSMISEIAKAALPISIGAAVGTVMSLIDSIIVPERLLVAGFTLEESAILYGQMTGKALTLSNVPLALSMALCATLVPIISEAYSTGRRFELERRVEMSFKLSFVIALPCTVGLYTLAAPIMHLIFLKDVAGYNILKFVSLTIPFVIITQTTTALLQSVGAYLRPVYNLAIGCIIKVVISYMLVSITVLNIYGAVIGTMVGYIVTVVLNMIQIRKIFNTKIDLVETLLKPAIGTLLMAFSVVFVYNTVYKYTISNTIACLFSIFAGVIIYLVAIITLKVFEIEDIKGKFIKN